MPILPKHTYHNARHVSSTNPNVLILQCPCQCGESCTRVQRSLNMFHSDSHQIGQVVYGGLQYSCTLATFWSFHAHPLLTNGTRVGRRLIGIYHYIPGPFVVDLQKFSTQKTPGVFIHCPVLPSFDAALRLHAFDFVLHCPVCVLTMGPLACTESGVNLYVFQQVL